MEEFLRSRIQLYNRFLNTWDTAWARKLAELIINRYEYELRKLKQKKIEKGIRG